MTSRQVDHAWEIVSIVGTDGAGKSTLTKALASRSSRTDRPLRRIDRWDIIDSSEYPASRFITASVDETRAAVAELPGPTRFLFLAWSTAYALLGQLPDQNSDFLLDGYWMKHGAAEVAYGQRAEWVESVTAVLPRPHLTIFLRVEPEVAWQRKASGDIVPYECAMDPSCSQESFISHQRALLKILDEWAIKYGWIIVDGDQSADAILSEVEVLISERRNRYAGEIV